MACSSCCSNCFRSAPQYDTDPPFALSNVLPAGTVQLGVLTDSFCGHVHSDDGWHVFSGDTLLHHMANLEDSQLCDELDYLVEHEFIFASYGFGLSRETIHVRIYIIPFDLPNVDGKLLNRTEDVLKPARRYLWHLLPMIDKSQEKWEARVSDSSEVNSEPFLPVAADNRTMAGIYGDLPSPTIGISSDPRLESIISRLLSGSGPYGLMTELYGYQRRSVVAMLQRELPNKRADSSGTYFAETPDPLFIPIVGIDGQQFYLQPAKMLILKGPPKVSPTRGGILCEELGTGKTLMILTLILATLNDLPTPETPMHRIHPPAVMTPLAFRHFPGEFEAERKRITGNKLSQFSRGPQIPSLVELLLHHLRVPRAGFQPVILQQYQDELEDRKLYGPLVANTPFYHHEDDNVSFTERPKRNQKELGSRVLFLTSASLVVVPTNLQGQWYSEIQKHTDSQYIRVLRVTAKTVLPPAHVLASRYDIILMTYHRFSAEATEKDVLKLHDRPVCRCPSLAMTRVPDCSCGHVPGVSPLLQIRWKRLVIDEGHVSASLFTNLIPFSQLLSIERRWIVTGTPTTNLLGLGFGQSSELEIKDDDDQQWTPESSSVVTSNSDDTAFPRRWTRYDREDLRKLDNMATHFLGVPHFKAEPKTFGEQVTTALFGAEGLPLPGATQVLSQVMQSVMIRHRIEDVEQDITLLPITQETVLLDLEPLAVKAYNALLASVAINAVDSERKDQDYLFHPMNAEPLGVAVQNISQALFWKADPDLYNVDEMVKNAPDMLQNAMKRKISQHDSSLLQNAFMHGQAAAADPLWRSIQTQPFVPYRVYNLDETVFRAWSRTISPESLAPSSATGFIHSDRLVRMRAGVLARPLIPVDNLVQLGCMAAQEDLASGEPLHNSPRKKSKHGHNKETSHQPSAVKWAKSPASAEIREVRKELALALRKQEDVPSPRATKPPSPTKVQVGKSQSHLLRSSLLARARIGSSCSTKLNYILNEVLQHAAEKFLIFSSSPLSLSYVEEGLQLFDVKYLKFSTKVEPQVREQYVTTFETSDTFRVFLMELRHGARGLNLISASRVIFCEPVWQADVESQAIKRVHRIGQTKPVNVKTLVIRSTVEENMMARKEALKGQDGKLPKLTEEVGMRHYMANPIFIKNTPTHLCTLDAPLVQLAQRDSPNRHDEAFPVGITIDHGDVREEPVNAKRVSFVGEDGSPRKKSKPSITFVM